MALEPDLIGNDCERFRRHAFKFAIGRSYLNRKRFPVPHGDEVVRISCAEFGLHFLEAQIGNDLACRVARQGGRCGGIRRSKASFLFIELSLFLLELGQLLLNFGLLLLKLGFERLDAALSRRNCRLSSSACRFSSSACCLSSSAC
jgi:hypothetical protein